MVKQHIPILVKEIVAHIPEHARCIVDGTFGHGGHTKSFLQYAHQQSDSMSLWCFDRDHQVMARGKGFVEEMFPTLPAYIQIHYVNHSYATMASHLKCPCADFVLLDLGINWEHVTDNARGFSFQGDGPLDMRFDTTRGVNALELIQSVSMEDMAQWFIQYGDYHERRAKQIAQLLFSHRYDTQLQTTGGLIQLLKTLNVRKHEFAPIFQSIRIATNNEFGHLDAFVSQLGDVLASGGRCAIITFHSIEDRIVKYHFKTLENTGQYRILTKHVIKPHWQEVQRNKAARSAKLRIIEKL